MNRINFSMFVKIIIFCNKLFERRNFLKKSISINRVF